MIPDSINRAFLIKFIHDKVSVILKAEHVLNVIVLLFDELIKDLNDDKKITITNFGCIYLQKTNPKLYFDIVEKRLKKSI